MTISIFLADNHPIVRQGLRDLLEAKLGFSIISEADDGLEIVRLVERFRPDILILDLMIPGLSGLDVIPIVKQRSPRTRVVVFTMYGNEAFVQTALKNGALGYVLKSSPPDHVLEAVKAAAAGRRYLSPPLSVKAIETRLRKDKSSALNPHESLTPRQREVFQLATEGHTNAEIAKRLHISPRTVEMHRARAMRKLGLRSQADLIRYALHRGLLLSNKR